MNGSSIKTVLMLAVLGAVGYGVYVTLNKGPGGALPPGVPEWLSGPPRIELSTSGAATHTAPGASAAPNTSAAGSRGPAGPNFALTGPGNSATGAAQSAASAGQAGAAAVPAWNLGGTAGVGSAPDSPRAGPSWAGSEPVPPASSLAQSGPGSSAPRWGSTSVPEKFGASSSPAPDAIQNGQQARPATDPFASADAARTSSPSSAGSAAAQRPSPLDGAPGSAVATDRPEEEIRRTFEAVWESATTKLNRGNLAEAHLVLSEWYGDPRLPPDQNRRLAELLSQLAGTVIYSRQHLLERPYVVQLGDTLERIAQAYNVPWQLLAKINGLRGPNDLQPGQELKVVRGPFHAILDLRRYELVLMLDGRYAGRFPIGVGRDCPTLEGRYVVRGKTLNAALPSSNGAEDGSRFSAGRWIDLGNGIGIHGTSETHNIGRTEGRGVIFVAERDIEDLYDILSVGSNSSNGSSIIVRR